MTRIFVKAPNYRGRRKIILEREVEPRFLLPVMNVNQRSREGTLEYSIKMKIIIMDRHTFFIIKKHYQLIVLAKTVTKNWKLDHSVSKWLELLQSLTNKIELWNKYSSFAQKMLFFEVPHFGAMSDIQTLPLIPLITMT